MLSKAKSVAFLVCDIQERFVPLIYEMESVIRSAVTLCKTAEILELPIVVTEQYPKALGKTEERLRSFGAPTFEKTRFSMLTPEVDAHLLEQGVCRGGEGCHAVLFGIEAHVCVQQTAQELLQRGTTVHIVADAVSSQRPWDRAEALRQLQVDGARITTTESVMLGLLGDASHERFKPVSQLLIQHNQAWKAEDAAHWASLSSDGRTRQP